MLYILCSILPLVTEEILIKSNIVESFMYNKKNFNRAANYVTEKTNEQKLQM